jgi:hypothetical protein
MTDLGTILAGYLPPRIYERAFQDATTADDLRQPIRDLTGILDTEVLRREWRGELLSPQSTDIVAVSQAATAWGSWAASNLSDGRGDRLHEAAENAVRYDFIPSYASQFDDQFSSICEQLANSADTDPAGAEATALLNSAEADLTLSIRAVVEDRLRLRVNEISGDNYDNAWRWEATPALKRSLVDAEYQRGTIETRNVESLAALAALMDGGSLGIAGPRGVGKSTILHWLGSNSGGSDRPSYTSVLVSAPVNYDAREFVLNLFAETCRRFLPERLAAAPDVIPSTLAEDRPSDSRRSRRQLAQRLSWFIRHFEVRRAVLTALAMACVALAESTWQAAAASTAIVALAVDWVKNSTFSAEQEPSGRIEASSDATVPRARRVISAIPLPVLAVALWGVDEAQLQALRVPLLLMIAGLFLLAFVAPFTIWSAKLSSVDRRQLTWPTTTLPRFVGPLTPIIYAGGWALVSSGAVGLVVTLFPWEDRSWHPNWPPGSTAVGGHGYLVLTLAILLAVGVFTWRPPRPPHFRRESPRESLEGIQQDALRELRNVQLQQQVSMGQEATVGVSGGKLLQLSAKGSSGETWTPRPMGYAELVGRYRNMLGRLASKGDTRILIGIDELDKIEDVGDVAAFLNNLKGIFGVPNVLYITTISNEAAASFKRKGAPIKEAFDSCFDDVVVLSPLTYEDTRRVLNSRVLGMPRPFKALLHAMSGGVPREVLRLARRLQLIAEENEITLAHAASVLARSEVTSRLEAMDLLSWPSAPTPFSRNCDGAQAKASRARNEKNSPRSRRHSTNVEASEQTVSACPLMSTTASRGSPQSGPLPGPPSNASRMRTTSLSAGAWRVNRFVSEA